MGADADRSDRFPSNPIRGASRAKRTIRAQRRPAPKKPLCARSPGGLELHAEVTIAAHDRFNTEGGEAGLIKAIEAWCKS
jgi:hypothetical protein